jgi:hypothetical protein
LIPRSAGSRFKDTHRIMYVTEKMNAVQTVPGIWRADMDKGE